ncbi:MAG: hypothetical protein K0Q72_2965 [Armatimonadetes bacterium]|nr:hypothetical protein [Armatimonadota bacterium]
MRSDLLALTADDLVTLANRGIVKRAQTELDSGQFTFEADEAEGAVSVRWSDEVTCLIPAGKGLQDARCTCPATTLCRHVIRSVLAYQKLVASEQSAVGVTEAPDAAPPPEPTPNTEHQTPNTDPLPPTPEHLNTRTPDPWDPGAITDEVLEREIRKPLLARARRQFDEGLVLELVRSAKPTARFFTLGCTLRFLVPGDLRYTHCDCADPNPCGHVPLAVWAFRMLDADRSSGTFSTRKEAYPVPSDLLDEIEASLLELCAAGAAGTASSAIDRLRRLETRSREAGLIWPGEILAELVQQLEAYAAHDARFSPVAIADLAGELCIRMDAIRADTGEVPQLFIRGSESDRLTDVGNARLVGLGCGAAMRRGGVQLSAYLQDVDSGQVVAVSRDFADPPADSGAAPAPLWELARVPVLKGVPLTALGAGQLLVQGGKRTPGGTYQPGRARFSCNPQSFQWESLRPPVLVEDLAELTLRLAAQPPAALRPRRVASDLVVCAVGKISAMQYSELEQALYLAFEGAGGGEALAVLPFVGRAREGMDALLARLRDEPDSLRFIAGKVRLSGPSPLVTPISLVFGQDRVRQIVQPWVDRVESTSPAATASSGSTSPSGGNPIAGFPGALTELLGEQWLLGLRRADERMGGHWRELSQRGAAIGFDRLIRPVERIAAELERKRATLNWNPDPAARAMLQLAVLARIASEQSAGT